MVRIQLFSFITRNSLVIYSIRFFSSSNSSTNTKQARKLVRTILRKPGLLRMEPVPKFVKISSHLNLSRFRVTRVNSSSLLGIQNQLYQTSKVSTGSISLRLSPSSTANTVYLRPFRVFRGEVVPQSKLRRRSFFRAIYHKAMSKRLPLRKSVSKGVRRSSVRYFNTSYLERNRALLPKRYNPLTASPSHEVTPKLINRRGPFAPSLISG